MSVTASASHDLRVLVSPGTGVQWTTDIPMALLPMALGTPQVLKP